MTNVTTRLRQNLRDMMLLEKGKIYRGWKSFGKVKGVGKLRGKSIANREELLNIIFTLESPPSFSGTFKRQKGRGDNRDVRLISYIRQCSPNVSQGFRPK